MDLPGIGSVLASRIVDYRRQHGDFARVEDLRNVSGIGEKRYEAIYDKVTVG
jgi:competence protein ComEA